MIPQNITEAAVSHQYVWVWVFFPFRVNIGLRQDALLYYVLEIILLSISEHRNTVLGEIQILI